MNSSMSSPLAISTNGNGRLYSSVLFLLTLVLLLREKLVVFVLKIWGGAAGNVIVDFGIIHFGTADFGIVDRGTACSRVGN